MIPVYIPSYNNAGNVSTLRWFPDAKIVVCESQYKDYEKDDGEYFCRKWGTACNSYIKTGRIWPLKNVYKGV